MVECLTCSGNRIEKKGAIAIAESLKVNNTLQLIDLGGERSWLKCLTCSGNKIGNEGGTALYASLAHNSQLQTFVIDSIFIPNEFKNKSLEDVRNLFLDLKSTTKEDTLAALKKWRELPLFWSCRTGNVEMVKRFLEAGANPSAANKVEELNID